MRGYRRYRQLRDNLLPRLYQRLHPFRLDIHAAADGFYRRFYFYIGYNTAPVFRVVLIHYHMKFGQAKTNACIGQRYIGNKPGRIAISPATGFLSYNFYIGLAFDAFTSSVVAEKELPPVRIYTLPV